MNRAKELAVEWWVDELDLSKSWSRCRIEMSYEDVLKTFDDSCHFVVIHRKGFKCKKGEDYNFKWKGEIGFATMTGASYYLWIWVTEKDLKKIVKEFRLELLEPKREVS